MEEHPLNQSTQSRAWQDTKDWLLNHIITWFLSFLVPGAGTMLATSLIPLDADIKIVTLYGFIGGMGGLVLLLVGTYVWNFFRAPYKQRNEAIEALKAIPGATPDTLRIPSPPQLLISCKKHEFGVDGESNIITVYAEYRPTPIGKMKIESIVLRLLGQPIPCLDWKMGEVSHDLWFSSNNKFRLPDGISPGEHDVKLAAFANGEWWGSQSFTITVPQVNS